MKQDFICLSIQTIQLAESIAGLPLIRNVQRTRRSGELYLPQRLNRWSKGFHGVPGYNHLPFL
jgi:hypothetical protein